MQLCLQFLPDKIIGYSITNMPINQVELFLYIKSQLFYLCTS